MKTSGFIFYRTLMNRNIKKPKTACKLTAK